MLNKFKNNAGFTIVEVVISALIFSLAAAGIFATVTSLQTPTQNASDEVTAAFIAKQVLEDLRNSVDTATWEVEGELAIPGEQPLDVGTHGPNLVTIDGIDYSVTYIVSNDPSTGARKVDLTVTW